MAVFTASSFAGAALASNLVPALLERGLTPTAAGAVGGLFGIMQLPGRLLFMRHTGSVSPMVLVAVSMGLQVIGLASLAMAHSVAGIAAGVSLFAGGSGLATIARPFLVLVYYGQDRAGEMNGRFARPQQLARAAGPVGVAAMAEASGYGFVFALLAGLLAAVALLIRANDVDPGKFT